MRIACKEAAYDLLLYFCTRGPLAEKVLWPDFAKKRCPDGTAAVGGAAGKETRLGSEQVLDPEARGVETGSGAISAASACG